MVNSEISPRLPIPIKLLIGVFIGLLSLIIILGIGSNIFTNVFFKDRIELEQIPISGEASDPFFQIIPLYKDSTIISKSQSDDITKITLETQDPVGLVSQFYETNLKGTGWVKESSHESDQTATVTYIKQNLRVLISVSLNEEERTQINITYEGQPY